MTKMEFVKSENWTRKSDAMYLVRMPIEVIKVIPAILMGEPKINEMNWFDYIDLANSFADMKCGRLYRLIQ